MYKFMLINWYTQKQLNSILERTCAEHGRIVEKYTHTRENPVINNSNKFTQFS